MSFVPKAFGGLAYGLVDGKPGALSNVGGVVGGPIDALGIGKATQRMVDGTGVNGRPQGQRNSPYYKPQDGTSTPSARSGRGSSSLSV